MSDQSDNLNYCFLFVLLFQIYICSKKMLKICIIIYKQSNNWNLKFSIIYLKCWSSCLYCCHWISSGVIDITHSFDHDKSSSISLIIHGKSRNLQKLLKYLNGTILSFSGLPINFTLYSKDLFVIVLFHYHHHHFQ